MYIEGAIIKSCSCGWIEFHPMTIVLFCAISLLLSLPLSRAKYPEVIESDSFMILAYNFTDHRAVIKIDTISKQSRK